MLRLISKHPNVLWVTSPIGFVHTFEPGTLIPNQQGSHCPLLLEVPDVYTVPPPQGLNPESKWQTIGGYEVKFAQGCKMVKGTRCLGSVELVFKSV